MNTRVYKKEFIIYPENRAKFFWDFFITFILLLSVIIIPLKLALENEFSDNWDSFLIVIDLFFLLDIILSFFTAYDDEDFVTNDGYK